MHPVTVSIAHADTSRSRQSLKKYVKANNTINVSDKMFDSLFNKALKAGVDKGFFEQPKGPSGGTKLAKKAATPAAPKKETKPKETKEKKPAAPKKAAAAKRETKPKEAKEPKEAKAKEPKEAKEKKPAAPKKEKKAAAPKKVCHPSSHDSCKAPSNMAQANAVVEKPTILTKTKSGRVAKTSAKPAAAAKKATPKKATPKKEKTPKKAEKAEAPAA